MSVVALISFFSSELVPVINAPVSQGACLLLQTDLQHTTHPPQSRLHLFKDNCISCMSMQAYMSHVLLCSLASWKGVPLGQLPGAVSKR